MVSPATSTHLPRLELPHQREPVGGTLQATLHEVVRTLVGPQWMFGARLEERA
jgi:hypothetical protein